jgi:hypothetical protein
MLQAVAQILIKKYMASFDWWLLKIIKADNSYLCQYVQTIKAILTFLVD